MKFIKAYVKSMRLYYGFITGIAGWVGIEFYGYIARISSSDIYVDPSPKRKALILAILFLSWGVNQIINDYLGMEEDKINAPMRPMVTGELNYKKAILLSFIVTILSFILVAIYLEPIAIVPAVIGILLNILYEYAKGHGILGNIVFGAMIATCPFVGLLASGPIDDIKYIYDFMPSVIVIAILNGVMTFYTYFKDYEGDKAAGKRTLIVMYGIEKAKIISIVMSFVPLITVAIMYATGYVSVGFTKDIWFLFCIAAFMQFWNGYQYYKHPVGKETYYSLVVNFQACVLGQVVLIAFYNPDLAIKLFIITYIGISFLFSLHSNREA
ncbi:MAG TPA: ubiquinone biosynthesis protein UbiA [Clostridiales bacterium]|nr:MAG: ubiquinone biosynthesis protein UbiA [Clostridiales bacterium GWD2_32_59]HAN09676.1 ubiquinone biosynthesis protein UbiA [Clostridiales bacterium]